MDKISELVLKILDFVLKNKDHQSTITYLGIIVLSILHFDMRNKIITMSDEINHMSLRVNSPELQERKLIFEQRGRETWDAGKEAVIEWIKKNHNTYKKTPILYKAKVLYAGGEVLDEQIKITKKGFGERTQDDFKVLSIKTFYPFVVNLNRWIDMVCGMQELPVGWEFQVSSIFNNATTSWILELNRLNILYNHSPFEETPIKKIVVYSIAVLPKKPYLIKDLENGALKRIS